MATATFEEIRELRKKKDAMIAEAEALMAKADDEKRAMTDDELSRFDGLFTKAEEMRKEVDGLDQERRRQLIRDAKNTSREIEPRSTKPYQPGQLITPERIKRAQARGLKVFRGEGAAERAAGFAHFVFACRGVGRSRDYLEKRGIEMRSAAEQPGLGEKRAMGVGTESTGGYLTPIEFGSEIIDIMGEVGAIRQALTVWPMSRDVMSVPKVSTRPTWGALTENTAPSEAGGTGGYVTLTAKKAGGLSKVSNELSDDSLPYVGDVLARDIGYQAAYFEDQCLLVGDGSATYLSITGAINATGAAGQTTAAGATCELVTLANFLTVLGTTADYALVDLHNPVWIFNRSVFARTAMRLMYAVGGNTKDDLGDGIRPSLFGYPVLFSSALSASPTTGQFVAFFGSLETGAAFGDRRDLTIEYSPHFYFGDDAWAIRGKQRFAASVHDAAGASTKASTAYLKLA